MLAIHLDIHRVWRCLGSRRARFTGLSITVFDIAEIVQHGWQIWRHGCHPRQLSATDRYDVVLRGRGLWLGPLCYTPVARRTISDSGMWPSWWWWHTRTCRGSSRWNM